MRLTFQIGGVVLVWAALSLHAQTAKEVPGGTPQPKPALKPAEPPAKAPANAGVPKGAPRFGILGENPIQRLLLVSPEQRELAIEKLPAGEQARAHQIFEDFDRRTPLQKQQYLRILNQLWSLPEDKQALVRQRGKALNQLSDERRVIVMAEWRQLSHMPDDERRALIASEVFKHKYTPDEQQILADLSEYYPAP
jgi:hypothetical protein